MQPDDLSFVEAELPQPNGLNIVRLSTVARREIEWVWPQYLPKGRITVLSGDPGEGKSWYTLAVAAHLSQGWALPGMKEGELKPGRSLIFSAEDDPADTIRARADDLGADPDMIDIVTSANDKQTGQERPVSLLTDLSSAEHYLAKYRYAYWVIDPINAYLGTELDTHRDAAVRSVLTPIDQLARKHGVAVICVMHLTKGSRERAIYRTQGTIAYTAAARVALLLGRDRENKRRRHVIPTKFNIGETPPGLMFDLEDGRLLWAGNSDLEASELLAPEPSAEDRALVDEALEFVRDALKGGALEQQKVFQQAHRNSIREPVLRQAKARLLRTGELDVRKDVYGSGTGWIWQLATKQVAPVRQPIPSQEAMF